MKKLFTAVVAVAIGLALEGALGGSHRFATLTARQKLAAAIGLAVIYLAGLLFAAARHRSSQRAAEQSRRPSGFSAYR